MPHSQRGVFASSGYAGYWRRVQKSFTDYVGSRTIGRVPNPIILSASIVSIAMSSKIGFVEWHASRGGWVTYAQDFPKTWSGCDLIIGTSSGVPIKRGAVKAIGVATPVGKGKEKRIKQEKLKGVELEKSMEGAEASLETKRRKTGKSHKQLVIFEEIERIGSLAVGKEVAQSLATRA